ncbi:alpha/beta fold hydrolase [Cellulomonas carbonis]|uniref:Alpha/beta hydrolase n=1 Tax=Cellulomonas carbonis T26 TaxID=947969 RepID=A0A0A0BVR7_9CELL|nr:alpha/beta hydrolase [Cellulomonas carbonis]KGM12080.1 alpha/beta hydrolase [Cellulomonas carbonis T26]GGC08308.1 hydrolase [Cellulomonas carbonis]
MTDSSAVLIDGPWRHHFVAANGARFHVAVSEPAGDGATDGTAPLVVLLHGFPQMWWAWRHQLPVLAAAGYRAVAMDLRGAGASDKPPIGNDVPTLARDVAGVVRSLGARTAVVVGQGLGATVAWSMPALQPRVTRAVAALSTPHPAAMHTAAVARHLATRTTARRLGFFQLPWLPERRMLHGDLAVRLLTEWGAPGWLDAGTAETYRTAARVPFAAHSGMEQLRWLVRSTPRVDGQRYLAAVRRPVEVPVLQAHGTADRCIPVAAARAAAGTAPGSPLTFRLVEGAGHFLAEEAPEATTDLLVDWLGRLPVS